MIYTDIHTHRISELTNVLSIRNVIVGNKDIYIEDGQYFSAGIHPCYINYGEIENYISQMKELHSSQHCLAVGECGLDHLCDIPKDIQEMVFQKMIQLSEENKKPLIIHSVRTQDEIIHWHKKIHPSQQWIMHGFNRKPEICKQLTDRGIFCSFGAAVLANTSAIQSLKTIPDGMFFLETDEADAGIDTIFDAAAEIRGINQVDLAEQLLNQFKYVFKINE